MAKWNVLDKNGELVGIVSAESEAEALKKAEEQVPDAATVEEKPEAAEGHAGRA